MVDLKFCVAVVGASGKLVPPNVVESCAGDYLAIEAGQVGKPVTVCAFIASRESAQYVGPFPLSYDNEINSVSFLDCTLDAHAERLFIRTAT